jgi:hypothetical protein
MRSLGGTGVLRLAISIGLTLVFDPCDMARAKEVSEMVFSSRADAEAFLTRELPIATAANPYYRGKDDGVETQWLTKSVRFTDGPDGAIVVAMEEEFTEIRANSRKPGTHEASFSLREVRISTRTDDTQLTPSGEDLAIIFNCAAPKCVHAKWNGEASTSDWTDISLQDPSTRGRILAAFKYLEAIGAKTPP